MTSDNENALKVFQCMDQTRNNDQRFLFVNCKLDENEVLKQLVNNEISV